MTESLLKMPRLGETMEEGKVVGWLVEAGQEFRRGDPLIEIETDKTIAEFPALGDGRLIEFLVDNGGMVDVDAPIARIDIGTGPDWTRQGEEEVQPRQERAPTIDTVPVPAEEEPRREMAGKGGRKPRATPVARRLAEQHGVNLQTLRGSGRRSRIEKQDVLNSVSSPSAGRGDFSYVDLPTGRYAYADRGTGDLAPILLLHGFAGDHTTWSGVAAALQRAGRRVIIPDLPAHGSTSAEAADTEDLSVDLPRLLEKIVPGAHVHVVAHSMGAIAAVELAQSAPNVVERITLLSPAGIGPEIDVGFIRGMAGASTAGEVSHLLRRLSFNATSLSAAALSELASRLSKGRLAELADCLASVSGQRIDILPDLAGLSELVPVRVLVGLQDKIIPWSQVTSLPHRVAVHFLPRSGHMPQWDQTKDVVDIILES